MKAVTAVDFLHQGKVQCKTKCYNCTWSPLVACCKLDVCASFDKGATGCHFPSGNWARRQRAHNGQRKTPNTELQDRHPLLPAEDHSHDNPDAMPRNTEAAPSQWRRPARDLPVLVQLAASFNAWSAEETSPGLARIGGRGTSGAGGSAADRAGQLAGH